MMRPSETGFAPSTSLAGSIAPASSASRTPPGNGVARMIPWTARIAAQLGQRPPRSGSMAAGGAICGQVDDVAADADLGRRRRERPQVPGAGLVGHGGDRGQPRQPPRRGQFRRAGRGLSADFRREFPARQQLHRVISSRTAATIWSARAMISSVTAAVAVSSALIAASVDPAQVDLDVDPGGDRGGAGGLGRGGHVGDHVAVTGGQQLFGRARSGGTRSGSPRPAAGRLR